MGFRYRKSINMGGGFRINLSKSGVGYSWGVKGARITKTADGRTRKTLSIPGTGLSYVEESGSNKRNSVKKVTESIIDTDKMEFESAQTISVDDYRPAEYEEFIKTAGRVHRTGVISFIMLCSTIFGVANPLFGLVGLAGLVLAILTLTKWRIRLEYELDEQTSEDYKELREQWLKLRKNTEFNQITDLSQGLNKKTHGGAEVTTKIEPVKMLTTVPFFLKSNVRVFGLKLRKNSLYFLPDKLLVVSGFKIGALNYDDVTITVGKAREIVYGKVPRDQKIIDKVWLKTNKDGTPDKRYSDNRQVPLCEYGVMGIDSGKKLKVILTYTNSSMADVIRIPSEKYFKNFVYDEYKK